MSSPDAAVRKMLAPAVTSALVEAAVSPTTDLKPADVNPIAQSVLDEIAPIVENATNQEPWYQSRVILGSVGALIATAGGVAALVQQGVTDVTAYVGPVTAFVFAAFALYGRLVALKPLKIES